MALITNQSGGSAHQYFYTPYGELLDNNGKLLDSSNFTGPHNQYTLTGKPLDAESGLTYFGARYYDAANGAWLTRDPLPGSIPQAAGLTQVSPALGAAFFDAYSFTTLDTLSMRGSLADPLGRNRYLFNRANPLSFIDPTGCVSTGPGGCVIPNHPWLCPPPSSGDPTGGGQPQTGDGGGDTSDPGSNLPSPYWPPYLPPPPPPPPSNMLYICNTGVAHSGMPSSILNWCTTSQKQSDPDEPSWEELQAEIKEQAGMIATGDFTPFAVPTVTPTLDTASPLERKILEATVVITWGYFDDDPNIEERCRPPDYISGCFGHNSSLGTLVDGGFVTHDHFGSNPTETEERRKPPESESSLSYLKYYDWIRLAGASDTKYMLTSELTGIYPTKGTTYLETNLDDIGTPTNHYILPHLPGDPLYYTFIPGQQIEVDPYPNNLIPHHTAAVGQGIYNPPLLPGLFEPPLIPGLDWPIVTCEGPDAQHCPSLGDSGAGIFNSIGELVGVNRGGIPGHGSVFYAPY